MYGAGRNRLSEILEVTQDQVQLDTYIYIYIVGPAGHPVARSDSVKTRDPMEKWILVCARKIHESGSSGLSLRCPREYVLPRINYTLIFLKAQEFINSFYNKFCQLKSFNKSVVARYTRRSNRFICTPLLFWVSKRGLDDHIHFIYHCILFKFHLFVS